MNIKMIAASAATALALGLAMGGSAQAATVVSACKLTDITPTADACSGWFDGNLLNTSGTHIQDQKDALAALGFVWDGDWATAEDTKVGQVSDIYDFDALLNGVTFIGIHKGKGGKDGFESTAFFKLTADNLDTFKLNLKGGSDAVLYSTGAAVPEPATWAMMIIGFGAVGTMARSTRRRSSLA